MVSSASLTALALGLLAGWIAAGVTGIWGPGLQRVLVWLGGAGAMLFGCSMGLKGGAPRAIIGVAALVWILMTASTLVSVRVMGMALLLAGLALAKRGPERSVLSLAAAAMAVLSVFRLVRTTIPEVWLLADTVGSWMGRAGGWMAGRDLWVGATFGGVDYLVVMGVLYVGWLMNQPRLRWRRALLAGAGILAGHLVFLLALAYAPDLREALPASKPGVADPRLPRSLTSGDPWWLGSARLALPWNLPLLGAVIHTGIAVVLLRRVPGTIQGGGTSKATRDLAAAGKAAVVEEAGWGTGVLALAVLLPAIGSLWLSPLTLEGKKVVLYGKGYVDWKKPEHGDYGFTARGKYGLLLELLAALGACPVVSDDVEDRDLEAADVVVLVHPKAPWTGSQLARLWDYVERGGSLLLLGEHTTRDRDGSNRFNEVLQPTNLRVAFDSAIMAVSDWRHSFEGLAHPGIAPLPGKRNRVGITVGASVMAGWPASALLVGTWGWNDIGDVGNGGQRAMLGDWRYNAGEKLGDVLLAAEQPLGQGTIVVFGDTTGFYNGVCEKSHVFTSRLLAYLAAGREQSHRTRHRLGAWGCAAILMGLLIWRRSSVCVVSAALGVSLSTLACTHFSERSATPLLPEGARQAPNNLAYIDATHLNRYSDELWAEDGLAGLRQTLNRNGYLALELSAFTRERLLRAGLLISIAPARAFSLSDRQLIREFVEEGGVFISTVGYEERQPSAASWADLGFGWGASSTNRPDAHEPQPMGRTSAPYLDTGTYKCLVDFRAAWPIEMRTEEAEVIARGADGLPVAALRRIGKGKVVVIADSGFALNKNLERRDGRPIDGLRRNTQFWRWLITVLRDEPPWVPPKDAPVAKPGAQIRSSPAEGKSPPTPKEQP